MKKGVCVFIILLLAGILTAQSAVFIDELLTSKKITYAQAIYLVCVGNGEYQDTAKLEDIFPEAVQRKWVSAAVQPEKPITVAQYAYLVMRAFGIGGGLLYTLFPGPRYGYRELVYKGLIPGTMDPDAFVSGVLALRIVRIAAEIKGFDL